jgi:hypothetical protein
VGWEARHAQIATNKPLARFRAVYLGWLVCLTILMLPKLDNGQAAFCSPARRRGRCSSTSDSGLISSHLTEPSPCSGKTALAATIGLDSEFPFVKILSAETMVGLSEVSKSNMISKVSHAVCRDQGAKRRA